MPQVAVFDARVWLPDQADLAVLATCRRAMGCASSRPPTYPDIGAETVAVAPKAGDAHAHAHAHAGANANAAAGGQAKVVTMDNLPGGDSEAAAAAAAADAADAGEVDVPLRGGGLEAGADDVDADSDGDLAEALGVQNGAATVPGASAGAGAGAGAGAMCAMPCRLEGGTTCHIGAGDPPRKAENQDVVVWSGDCDCSGGEAAVGFVLDGHGQYGKLVADSISGWLESNVAAAVEARSPRTHAEWDDCLRQLFADCNEALKTAAGVGFRNKMSGATATVVVAQGGELHVAHAGDSRAILCAPNKSAAAERLTQDHRPELASERERIEAAGGVVGPAQPVSEGSPAPLRVWLGPGKLKEMGFIKPTPGLMLTRSIGDEVSKAAGCCSEPDVAHVAAKGVLVVASDGVWDVLSDDRVAELVHANQALSAEQVAQAIRDEALEGWEEKSLADNVGILVLRCAVG